MKRTRHGCLHHLLLSAFVVLFATSEGVCQLESSRPNFVKRQEAPEFQLRVMCWNVRRNSIYPPTGARRDSFARIVRAVEPDLICLQELWGGDRLVRLMNQYLPLDHGESWQVHTATDNVIVSRFPLLQREQELPVRFPLPQLGLPDFHYGQAMCVVDIPDEQCHVDFYLIAMHNKSRSGEESIRLRQQQSDSIVRWIRTIRQPDQTSSIPEKTPIIIVGDMNVLACEPADPAHHLTTLLTGNILDEKSFGPDFPLDWDDTNLIEVKPRHNARGKDFYTWRVDKLPFPPGALDRIIYTDSVLGVNHSFVLNTTTMTEQELDANGLLLTDSLWEGEAGSYDHLPLIADFSVRKPDAIENHSGNN
jgi:endonuclease/exonuclease/phosphatase family metal-dependent hydrolase